MRGRRTGSVSASRGVQMGMMTWFDYGVLLVLAMSMILGGWRGFVREAFALGGWIAAVLLAVTFAKPFAADLLGFIEQPTVRAAVAFVAIVLVVLIGTGLLGLLFAKLLRVAGLGLSDRVLGCVFGLARGFVIVLAFVLAAGLTALPSSPLWREAELAPPLETAAIALKPFLPAPLAERVRYR